MRRIQRLLVRRVTKANWLVKGARGVRVVLVRDQIVLRNTVSVIRRGKIVDHCVNA